MYYYVFVKTCVYILDSKNDNAAIHVTRNAILTFRRTQLRDPPTKTIVLCLCELLRPTENQTKNVTMAQNQ